MDTRVTWLCAFFSFWLSSSSWTCYPPSLAARHKWPICIDVIPWNVGSLVLSTIASFAKEITWSCKQQAMLHCLRWVVRRFLHIRGIGIPIKSLCYCLKCSFKWTSAMLLEKSVLIDLISIFNLTFLLNPTKNCSIRQFNCVLCLGYHYYEVVVTVSVHIS